MEGTAADAAFDEVVAAVAVLAELRRRQREDPAGPDPLRRGVDDSLDRLAVISRLEASTAALKVFTTTEYVDGTTALTPPAASPQENTAHEMAAIAELACVLTVSEPNAASLLSTSHRLTTALPLTLAALQAGTMSWQHARVMADETLNLDHAGAAALEAHFLDPAAPN
ncbi:endonuclease, partial [Pseudarthrobacter sp. H3Y2-7]|nr:endonuclease [Pseudarthrobacter sp. H3Y2-7]